MLTKYISVLLILLFSSGCNKELAPISVNGQSFEISYGTLTQVDNYPLFTMTYSSDYQFDEFLQNGKFPLVSSYTMDSQKFSCTCFASFGEENSLFGRNYDWPQQSSYLLLFTDPPDAYSSVSMVDLNFLGYDHDKTPNHPDNKRTFLISPYYPFDGMNEKGVVVGMNALAYAHSPYDPNKVTIGELHLIRLVLDYASSTSEAISLIQQYNIRMEEPPIHYLIADSSGQSVIVEFVNGKMEVISNTNPWQVTTNFVITGTDLAHPPCWRYQTAVTTLEQNNGKLSKDGAFNLLQSVSVSGTRWSTVFDLKSITLQIAMGRNYENLHPFSIP